MSLIGTGGDLGKFGRNQRKGRNYMNAVLV